MDLLNQEGLIETRPVPPGDPSPVDLTREPLRFPAERDQFRLIGCDPGVCVEELRSGARWALYGQAFSSSAGRTYESGGDQPATTR